MGKPVVRLGVRVDKDTWETLLKVEKFEGVRTFDFSIDTSQPTVWLWLVGEGMDVFGRLHDITTKEGGLPMKDAGEWRESAEAYQAYFRAVVHAARFERRLKGGDGVPQSEYFALKQDYDAAVRARDTAKTAFDAVLKRETEKIAEFDEDLSPDDTLYEHLGPAN